MEALWSVDPSADRDAELAKIFPLAREMYSDSGSRQWREVLTAKLPHLAGTSLVIFILATLGLSWRKRNSFLATKTENRAAPMEGNKEAGRSARRARTAIGNNR